MLLKNGNIVLEDSVFCGDLRICDEKISEIAEDIQPYEGEGIIDVSGKFLMPGVIDGHVHYKMAIGKMYTIDNFETGSRAAIAGGVTTVVDFTDIVPDKSIIEALKKRIKEAEGHHFCDHTFHVSIDGNMSYSLKDLKEARAMGVNSIKVYTTYSMIMDYDRIFDLMLLAREAGMIVSVHAEDNNLLYSRKNELIDAGKTGLEYYGESRPVEAESQAIRKIVEFCEGNDVQVHIMHVSSGTGANIIKESKLRGSKISAETCPQYLMLNNRLYQGTRKALYTISPPLRDESERLKLYRLFQDDLFDYIATDHCAFSSLQKEFSGKFYEVSGGMPGSETLLSIMHHCAVTLGEMSYIDLCQMLSTRPAKKFELYPRKGIIKVGSDGDIVVFDPDIEHMFKDEGAHTASDFSPFAGKIVKGMPVMTILRGRVMFDHGLYPTGDAVGEFIRCS